MNDKFNRKIALYPGSFDPFTNGHQDILKRALTVFEKVIVAVVRNPAKTPLFTMEERIDIIKNSVQDTSRVDVEGFEGLLVDFMRRKKIHILVKGLRAVSDFEFEFQMALMNRRLAPNIETVFLMTSSDYAFLSSSRVKEIASLGGNVESLVSDYTLRRLKKKFKSMNPQGQTLDIE